MSRRTKKCNGIGGPYPVASAAHRIPTHEIRSEFVMARSADGLGISGTVSPYPPLYIGYEGYGSSKGRDLKVCLPYSL
jgi:hypothetical protein